MTKQIGYGTIAKLTHMVNKKLNKHYDTKPFTKYVLEKHKLIGCEIGVYRGINAKNLLKVLPLEKLYLIDCEIQPELLAIDEENDDIVEVIEGYSDEVYKKFDDDYFDFIYIDTVHDERIKKDLDCWIPKLKKGGVIGGHGFTAHWSLPIHVYSYIDFNKLELAGGANDWWIRKNIR